MLRSKRKNKGVLKTFNYKDVIHYKKYGDSVLSFLDESNNEVVGINVVDSLVDIPDAALNDKKSIKCLGFGLGGTTLISINNRWRCMFGSTTLKTEYSPIVLPAPKDSKQILRQVTIPRINGKSVMQPGDMLRIFTESIKLGVANIHTRSFFFGSTGSLATDIEIDAVAAPTSSTNVLVELFEFYRMADSAGSSVIMKNLSKGGYKVNLGATQDVSVLPGESITIPNMDSNDTIVTFSAVLNGTSDTFTNNNWNVELLSTGP